MTGEHLRCTVLSSDVAWTFDAWGDNPHEPGDEEGIIFEHPTSNKDKVIELVIETDVPKLMSLPDDNVSVSSDGSNNTSESYCDLDDLVDNVLYYTNVLKITLS